MKIIAIKSLKVSCHACDRFMQRILGHSPYDIREKERVFASILLKNMLENRVHNILRAKNEQVKFTLKDAVFTYDKKTNTILTITARDDWNGDKIIDDLNYKLPQTASFSSKCFNKLDDLFKMEIVSERNRKKKIINLKFQIVDEGMALSGRKGSIVIGSHKNYVVYYNPKTRQIVNIKNIK